MLLCFESHSLLKTIVLLIEIQRRNFLCFGFLSEVGYCLIDFNAPSRYWKKYYLM